MPQLGPQWGEDPEGPYYKMRPGDFGHSVPREEDYNKYEDWESDLAKTVRRTQKDIADRMQGAPTSSTKVGIDRENAAVMRGNESAQKQQIEETGEPIEEGDGKQRRPGKVRTVIRRMKDDPEYASGVLSAVAQGSFAAQQAVRIFDTPKPPDVRW